MANPNQEAIETFMSIKGVSEVVATETWNMRHMQQYEFLVVIRFSNLSIIIYAKQEHGDYLNETVNAHLSEGDEDTSEVYYVHCLSFFFFFSVHYFFLCFYV